MNEDTPNSEEEDKIKRIKQLAQTICICKGISLGKMLKHIEAGDSVADVNRKSGSGSGGCKGERCSNKIAILIKKKEQLEKK